MYKFLVRPILFKFNPEKAHALTFSFLKFGSKLPGLKSFLKLIYKSENQSYSYNVLGINFPNRVGLAAGLDKDAEVFDMLGSLGFGFVEVGTVTPKAQPGNPKPRLFRLKKNKALINRMGFNNNGVEYSVKNLKQKKTNIIIGGNIGKNKLTPNEDALSDYEYCFEALYDYVDYFVVNVSSPNTPNLRELQDKKPLKEILTYLMGINNLKPKAKPILLKIAPDLTNEQLDDIVEIVLETKISGIVATNTTISREDLNYTKEEIENFGNGGLSGKPVREKSTEVIRYINNKSEGKITIIGVGGIFTPEDAIEKIEAGASLVQIYTSFIYEGPSLIKQINKIIKNLK